MSAWLNSISASRANRRTERARHEDRQFVPQNLFNSGSASLEVLATARFSVLFTLPQTPTIPRQLVAIRDDTQVLASSAVESAKPVQIQFASSDSSSRRERQYVLRVMTQVDAEGGVERSEDIPDIPLTDDQISDLGQLFRRLGDDRYRIYLQLEDGNELLLKDFYLRNHKPLEIEDSDAPDRTLPADDPALDLAPAAEGSSSVRFQSPTSEQADRDLARTSSVAVLAGIQISGGDGKEKIEKRSLRKAARRFRAG